MYNNLVVGKSIFPQVKKSHENKIDNLLPNLLSIKVVYVNIQKKHNILKCL